MPRCLAWERCVNVASGIYQFFSHLNDWFYSQLHCFVFFFFSLQVILCRISRRAPSGNPLYDSCPQAHSSASCYCFGKCILTSTYRSSLTERLGRREWTRHPNSPLSWCSVYHVWEARDFAMALCFWCPLDALDMTRLSSISPLQKCVRCEGKWRLWFLSLAENLKGKKRKKPTGYNLNSRLRVQWKQTV